MPASGASMYPIILADNITVDADTRAVQVLVKPLNDGEYRIKLIGDGKEGLVSPSTGNSSSDNTPARPCLMDGDAIGGISGSFHVVNPLVLTAFPDRFGPVWSSADLTEGWFVGRILKIHGQAKAAAISSG
ncbi:hypothetical protein BDEG_26550 [Batrachochytrium dendrobatidis JEL423]|uniref:Uncharacterized protein n=1 Tax=Batrachochytrium dendrobatidis (strain JEL423) TaxID=403673 RepID=A0A177WUQ3_BATDL|nr:hypothetical protein BDEG_26550 [Batrachochytrium dendrobatidis JEL423]